MRGSSIAAMYLLENNAKKDLKDCENNTALSIGFINCQTFLIFTMFFFYFLKFLKKIRSHEFCDYFDS